MRSLWGMELTLNPMTSEPISDRWRSPCGDKGKGGMDAATSLETPGATGGWKRQREMSHRT